MVRFRSIVYVCAATHATFAVGCILDPAVAKITALYSLNLLFGETIWIVLFAASLLSLIPMMFEFNPIHVHFFLWPQQFVLFLGAVSAVMSSVSGMYPDGYKAHSNVFIAADQCLVVYLTVAHLVALIRNARTK